MERPKKLEKLLRAVAKRIGAQEESFPEEQAVFEVLNEAMTGEEWDEPVHLRPTFLESLRRNSGWVALGAAVVIMIAVLAHLVDRDPIPQELIRVAHASEEGDLPSLFVSMRRIASLNLALNPQLARVAERLEDPDDPLLRTIEDDLSKRDDYAALVAAADRIAASRRAKEKGRSDREDGREDLEIEALLERYLLRHSYPDRVSKRLYKYAMVLIMRIFLENPVDTPREIADSKRFRDRLEATLSGPSTRSQKPELLYAISALSCCGSFSSAERLVERLQRPEVTGEERRLLLFSLERICRRSYICPEIDDLGAGRDWLREVFQQLIDDPRLPQDDALRTLESWLSFEESFVDPTRIKDAMEKRYRDTDGLDLASHLGRTFTPEELDELERRKGDELTEPEADPAGVGPGDRVLAAWDFSVGRFTHRGSARRARGILTRAFKEKNPNTGHIRLSTFGRSKLVLPFEIDEIPEEGITLKLRHLAASRNYVAYQGSARFSLRLNGRLLVEKFTVTHHGSKGWDSFRISKHHLWTGEHEFSISLSPESTTTYWIYEARIERR